MIKKIITTAIIFFMLVSAGCQMQNEKKENNEFPVLKGPYLGQNPPGMEPALFAPGIISTAYPDICISFSPDAKEVYYTMGGQPYSVVLFMKEENEKWTKPEVAPFSGRYSSECQLSPDGKTMYFCAGIPASDTGDPKGSWDIFKVDRVGEKWSEPHRLGAPLASDTYSADCPSIASNGNLYFYSSSHPDGIGKGDLYISKWVNGNYIEPENLGTAINTEYYDMDPFIAPDESYLIFSSIRPGGEGNNDLYISFKNQDGTWGRAVNMGEKVNSYAHEIHPFVSRDGKYLFFCSKRGISYKRFSKIPITYDEKLDWLTKPGNELEDIYWIDAGVIDNIRDTVQN